MASTVSERDTGARSAALPHLFGREHELARIDSVLEGVGELGQALLIRGRPGIGKSALLEVARARARGLGMQVMSTAGAPFEMSMPFAGLHRLLLPLLPEFETLPQHHLDVLTVALG